MRHFRGAKVYLKEQRYLIATMIVVSSMCLAGLLLFIASFSFRAVLPLAPFHYSAAFYLPSQTAYCQGQALTFTYASEITDQPFNALISRAIYRVDDAKMTQVVTYPLLVFPVRHTHPMLPVTRTFSETQILPPGQYVYEQNAQTLFSSVDGFSVPFIIAHCE